jgi:hypothetical protein
MFNIFTHDFIILKYSNICEVEKTWERKKVYMLLIFTS